MVESWAQLLNTLSLILLIPSPKTRCFMPQLAKALYSMVRTLPGISTVSSEEHSLNAYLFMFCKSLGKSTDFNAVQPANVFSSIEKIPRGRSMEVNAVQF